jgi:glycosyltransferase involved in cell wall biosynthesis
MVTGYVEDLRSLLMACGVVVVPLRNGGGTRIKVLEAMAMSKAVVSTSVGCEGLDVVHGKHLLVADQPEEFSRHCLALMADRPGRIRLGQNARQLVEEKYRLEVLPDIVDRILDKVAPARLQKSVQLVGK